MSLENGQRAKLEELFEALCEGRITQEQARNLEQAVLADVEAKQFYLHYIELHGNLLWDAATTSDAEITTAPILPNDRRRALPEPAVAMPSSAEAKTSPPFRQRRSIASVVSLAAGMLITVGLIGWLAVAAFSPEETGQPIAGVSPEQIRARQVGNGKTPRSKKPLAPLVVERRDGPSKKPVDPVPVVRNDGTDPKQPSTKQPGTKQPDATPRVASSAAEIVRYINERIEDGYVSAEVSASEMADDSEWVRRVYLDIVGHIPRADEVEEFLTDTHPQKRSRLVDHLLDDPDYARSWTTIWTNLLIGRSSAENVNRKALKQFLRRGFARNRPWSETVHELVSAEGTQDENGATNFLLAHLNNEAVPATAITSRLLLGIQVQCTQCHNHPFNDWKQNQFWEFNGFFQQTKAVRRKQQPSELITRKVGGPTYYETRQELVLAVTPKFNGVDVDAGPKTNRRRALADLMTSGEKPPVAASMVNRMWEHFLGRAFTQPVDDMGPHNPPTHPLLLDRLTTEFVRSGYDMKQLIRWVCNSRAYQLTSRFNQTNGNDDPEAGHPPLFSRVYVKPMTVEQLYDSLQVATRGRPEYQTDWETSDTRREEWMQGFVVTYNTDENDERMMLDGTMPQALLMMNGALTREAIRGERSTLLADVFAEQGGETDKIRQLCLATLSRYPSPEEVAAIRELLKQYGGGRRSDMRAGLQDYYWALLNSNEFVHVH
jgi:hypothetical protein